MTSGHTFYLLVHAGILLLIVFLLYELLSLSSRILMEIRQSRSRDGSKSSGNTTSIEIGRGSPLGGRSQNRSITRLGGLGG